MNDTTARYLGRRIYALEQEMMNLEPEIESAEETLKTKTAEHRKLHDERDALAEDLAGAGYDYRSFRPQRAQEDPRR